DNLLAVCDFEFSHHQIAVDGYLEAHLLQDAPDESGPAPAVVFIGESACEAEVNVVLIDIAAEIAVDDTVMITEPKTQIHVEFGHNGMIFPGVFGRAGQGGKRAVHPREYLLETQGARFPFPGLLAGQPAEECDKRLRNNIL